MLPLENEKSLLDNIHCELNVNNEKYELPEEGDTSRI